MKRAARLHAFPLAIDRSAPDAIWKQLAVGLRFAIATGRLTPGARLPSTRVLAARLGVSRNTIIAAYDELTARGLVVSRVGAGSFVGSDVRLGLSVRRRFRDPSGNLLTVSPLP